MFDKLIKLVQHAKHRYYIRDPNIPLMIEETDILKIVGHIIDILQRIKDSFQVPFIFSSLKISF